jgi:hypothetical protein
LGLVLVEDASGNEFSLNENCEIPENFAKIYIMEALIIGNETAAKIFSLDMRGSGLQSVSSSHPMEACE